MHIYFAGIESPSHLALLKSCGVERVAVNINNLARFTGDYGTWATKDRLGGLDWFCYADTHHCPAAPVLELLAGAEVACEAVAGPVTWAEDSWLNDSDVGFYPMWDGNSASVLRQYVEEYEGVMLPDVVVDNQAAVRTARAALPAMGQLAALTGRSKAIERFDTVVSSAWWAVRKHGETQIWAGNRLIRLNSEDKHLKRQRYADAIEALGCDVGLVLLDDPTETEKCAVLSWLKMEQHISSLGHKGPLVTSAQPSNLPANVTPLHGVASASPQPRHQALQMVTALANLPLMNVVDRQTTVTDAEGNEVVESHTTIEVTGSSARQCSTCQLSAACPSFTPGSACAYQIPVVIKTKDQRQAVMTALMEIQTQRILMGSFSEQVLGTPDTQVGREIDRLFTIIEKAKAIEENTSKLRISVDANGDQGPTMGLISRLFGEQAGQNAKALDRPMMTDELIEEAEMIDAPD